MSYFIIGLDKSEFENYSGGMGGIFQKKQSKGVRRRNALYAAQMKEIAFVQFKALAKKNIRLPIEVVTL